MSNDMNNLFFMLYYFDDYEGGTYGKKTVWINQSISINCNC